MRWFGPNINKMLQKGDVAGLIKALEHKNISKRQEAANALGQLGKTEVILPLMYAFVKESEISAREAIIKAITVLFTGQALNPMVHALADTNPHVQVLAGKLLAQVNYQATGPAFRTLLDDRAIDILIKALDHSNPDVISASANILSVMGDRSFSKLVAELQFDQSAIFSVRTGNMARVLGRIRNPQAIDPLVKVLGFDHSTAAEGAIEALEKFGPQIVPPLKTAMHSGNPNARKNALHILQRLNAPEMIEPLSKALDDNVICRDAALALANLGQPAYPILLAALEDKDKDWKREAACVGLGNLSMPEATSALILALEDEKSNVRAAAALALGSLKQSQAIPSLLLALGDSDYNVASNAKKALESLDEQQLAKAIEDVKYGKPEDLIKLNDSRAIPALFNMLANKNKTTRDGVLQVLESLGEATFIKAFTDALAMKPDPLIYLDDNRAIRPLVQLVLHGESNERRSAALCLGKWSNKGYDTLVKLIGVTDYSAKEAVIFGLGQSGQETALDHLFDALENKATHINNQIVRAIGDLGDFRATARLTNLLEDKTQSNSLRCELATALGKIGDPGALDSLKLVAKCNDSNLRRNAVAAIGKIGDSDALESLKLAARDKEFYVRQEALIAILEFSPNEAWKLIQRENDSRVKHSVLSAFATSDLLQFFQETEYSKLKFEILEILSGKTASEGLKQLPGIDYDILVKARETLLGRFAGVKWDKEAAQCLLKLFPSEASFDSHLIVWMNQAIGYDHVGYSSSNHIAGKLKKTTSDCALEALCSIKHPVTSNLLHIISKKQDVTISVDLNCAPELNARATLSISFADQRQQSLLELGTRGHPAYDVENFACGPVGVVEMEQAQSVIQSYRHSDDDFG